MHTSPIDHDDAGAEHADSSVSGVLGADAESWPLDPHALHVALTAERGALCVGECTTLSAVAEGGHAPYQYQWSDALLSGPSVRVCPTLDTTYDLTLFDSPAKGVELSVPPQVAHASITLAVRDCTVPAPSARELPSEACRMEITSAAGTSVTPESVPVHMQAVTASDAQGGVLVAGSFLGKLKLESSSLPTTVAESFRHFLAKYDADCRLQWSQFQGDNGVEVLINDVASDGLGNFAVLTSWNPASPAGDVSSRFLQVSKLRNDGTLLYSRRFNGMAEPYSLRMNARGELVFIAYADVDYGVSRTGTAGGSSDVVKLGADGQVVFVHGIGPSTASGGAALADDGTVYYGGVKDWDNPTSPTGSMTIYVTNLGPDGVARWEVTRAQQAVAPGYPRNGFLSVDSRGGLVLAVSEFLQDAVRTSATSWFLAPDMSTRSLTLQPIGRRGIISLDFDALEDVLLVTTPVGPGAAGDGADRQQIDARASDGSALWSYTRTGEANEKLMELSASAGQLVLTTSIDRPSPAQESRLIMSRLVFGRP